MKLTGKSAIVTGAARGIGAATAKLFAKEGAGVVCVDVAEDSLEDTVSKIRGGGGAARAVVADISTPDGNEAAVTAAREQYGGLDVLHINAAIIEMGDLTETDPAQWDRIHSTNLKGAYLGVRAAVPLLRKRGGGSIIFTASVLGVVGDPDLPAYGATKGALRSMCRSVAVAYARENIRCNAICPGDVGTDLYHEYIAEQPDPDAAMQQIESFYPLGRIADPIDVAQVAVFLASDEARYLTGTDIVVDGGLLARCY